VTYLVDANILSEPTKPAPHPKVVEWLRRNEAEIAVDPIILGELRFGILLLPKGRRRARLEEWFEAGIQRLLPEGMQDRRTANSNVKCWMSNERCQIHLSNYLMTKLPTDEINHWVTE